MPNIKSLVEGKYARVGISLVQGAVVKFISKGVLEPNSFDTGDDAKERLVIDVEINGEEKKISPNTTSMRELSTAWGTDTEKWIGKKATISVESKKIFGSIKDIVFFHPIEEPIITPQVTTSQRILTPQANNKPKMSEEKLIQLSDYLRESTNLAELDHRVKELQRELSKACHEDFVWLTNEIDSLREDIQSKSEAE